MDLDLTGSHPCPVPECRLSAEEHHRLNVGLVNENATLRKKVGQPDTTIDLSSVSNRDLLDEVSRRLEG